MKRFALISFLALAPAAFAAGLPGSTAPVKKFRMPTFNAQGYRTSLLVADEARALSASEVDLKEMNFSMFSGDESNSVDTTLLASSATLRSGEKNQVTVEGFGWMRLVRADLDVSGEQWTYRHPERKLSIKKNVRVVIRAELQDILK